MRKLTGLVLVIMLATLAKAQTPLDTVIVYSKDLRLEGDTVKVFVIKKVQIVTIAPKPDSGWRKEPKENGEAWADTIIHQEYLYSKVEKQFPAKGVNDDDFKNLEYEPSYMQAYKNPNKKISIFSAQDLERTEYSNYFLTKKYSNKSFWVMYHSQVKTPYFEVGFDGESKTETPWVRILFFSIFTIIAGLVLLFLFIEHDQTFTESLATAFYVNIVLGLFFWFCFGWSHPGIPFFDRVALWLVRYVFILLFMGLIILILYVRETYKDYLNKSNKKKEVDSNGESLIDTIAGSE